MKPFHIRTALIVACVALTAAPSFAQRGVPFSERGERQNGRGAGGGAGRREGVQRTPERGNQTERREAARPPEQQRGRDESGRRSEPRQRVAPPPRTETERRTEPRQRYDNPQDRRGDRDRRDDNRPNVARPYVARPYVARPAPRERPRFRSRKRAYLFLKV